MIEINKKNTEERKELFYFLLGRYENHRNSISSRSAVVLSAAALLVTGNLFFVEKALPLITDKYLYALSLVALFLSMFLLLISIIYAVNGIANVMKMARDSFLNGLPKAVFFHAPSTIDKTGSFEGFKEEFNNLNSNKISNYALLELWTVINQHYRRYSILTRSIRYLLLAIFPMFIVIFCFFLEKAGGV